MVDNNWSAGKISQIDRYLQFCQDRARGDIPTDATFIRNFVISHPSYQQDSIVPNDTMLDLLKMLASLDSNKSPHRSDLLHNYC